MNRIKARLQAGETVTAAWLELGSAEAAEAMAHAGWDALVIDCEHGAAGLERGLELIRAVEAAGAEAILRVPDAGEATLKRALDRGARSIMAPMVNDVETARRLAAFCLYPPRGRRGYAAPIVRASGYGARPGYMAGAHEELLLMAQIEHVDAVRDFEAIMAVEGIDLAFVGPNDLAGSMGLLEQLEAPQMAAALAEIEAKATRIGARLGTILGKGRDWTALRRLGYRLIVGPSDVGLMTEAARAAAAERDRALG